LGQSGIEEPFDLIRLSVDSIVVCHCKGDRELTGRLHAYDTHLNIVLGDVTETLTGPGGQKTFRSLEILYVRGENIEVLAPQRQ